jgi:hypothetical protein
MFPLAPPGSCKFVGGQVLDQDNGLEVILPSSGATIAGDASYSHPGQDDVTNGSASGSLTGSTIDINVTWTKGPGAGHTNHYIGQVNDDHSASGTTTNELGTTNGWTTKFKDRISCKQAPAEQAPAAQPKQAPTVKPNPGILGVTFHVTDRSGVASECTYSSEGFTSDSFSLPANGSFDLFVPAVREFRNRAGTVTCDNGTSANTSVFL